MRRLRRDIGMVFQQFNLFRSRTAAGNVEYPLKVAGWKRAERKARVAELLDFVGLSGKARDYPDQLSGGQKQEALGPLILGYTFVVIAIVDMSAMAGTVGGGGLGDFALVYGYQRFDWQVTLVATLIIIAGVQGIHFFGNWLARKVLRR